MLVSYILRLAPDALDDGRICGEVQFVTTGERHIVRTGDELIALLLRAQGDSRMA